MSENTAKNGGQIEIEFDKFVLNFFSMLHELLLALSGNCGGVFIKKGKNNLQVAADLPFIHDCEIILLNRICRLGSYYCNIQEFIEKACKVFDGSQDDKLGVGLYIQAFCTGLDQILEDYRHKLVLLEDKVLKDPSLPLSFIEHSLEEYQVLLPSLVALVDQIQTQKATGCKILDILHKSSISGIPHVKDAFERILCVCHGVLYKQLSAWLLHGLLIDSHDEFIITKATNDKKDESMRSEDNVHSDLGIGGVTGKQLSEIMEGENKPFIPALWQFKINAEMLPSYIPTRIAEKILFVGDSVKMFEDAKIGRGTNLTKSIVHDKEEEFLSSLYALRQRSHFSLTAFESEIDKIKTFVAQHLWKLVVEDANLLKHLQVVKDYFLLGRGELFSAFTEHAQHLLKVPPTNSTSHDINVIFQQVLHKFIPDDDESSSLFTLVIDMEAFVNKKKTMQDQGVISGWDCLNVLYNVQWPLHILFQKPILEKYNTLFRYLLNVKRTQQDLQRVWALHMGTKLQSSHFSHMTRVWLLRMHMAFLVDNLQYYLQVDVLEAQFSQLIEKINSTQDFESVRLAHDHFVTTLMSQSFLLLKPVAHCLDKILTLCQDYCSLLVQITDKLSEREETQIENIFQNYERQSNLLFKILSSVRGYQSTPHLAQLLLRIDFNKQFSSPASLSFSGDSQPSTLATHE